MGKYRGNGPVLEVGLESVGNRWRIGKLWEDAQWDPSADIRKISIIIQSQIQGAVDAHKPRTIWRKDNDGLLGKQPEASKIKMVRLSNTGLTIYLYDFQTRERLAWEFEKWTAELMPGATIQNAKNIREPIICGLVVNNINREKLNDDFRKRGSFRIFAENNPAIKYPSRVEIPYRVIDMEEVSESSWLITLNPYWAMKVLYGEPLNFFGVKTCDVELVARGRVRGDRVQTRLGRRRVNP